MSSAATMIITDNENNLRPKYYCKICSIDCRSEGNLTIHVTGKKHRTRAAQQEIFPHTVLVGTATASSSSVVAAEAKAATKPAKHYCDICSLDCHSPYNLLIHIQGNKEHKKREAQKGPGLFHYKSEPPALAAPAATTTTTKPTAATTTIPPISKAKALTNTAFWCGVCARNFYGKEAIEYHREYDPEHLKKVYRAKGIEFDESVLKEAAAPTTPTVAAAINNNKDDDDIDYSQIHDTERMLQTEFDDAVVELALHNYESYHAMKHGCVTYAMVNNTSAGILGWAQASVGDHMKANNNSNSHDGTATEDEDDEDCEPSAATDMDCKPSASSTNPHHRGDKQEEQSLRIAMMESMLESRGVRSARSHCIDHETGDDDDDDDCSYQYDDDEDDDGNDEHSYQYDEDEDDDDESEWEGEEDDEDDDEQEDDQDSASSSCEDEDKSMILTTHSIISEHGEVLDESSREDDDFVGVISTVSEDDGGDHMDDSWSRLSSNHNNGSMTTDVSIISVDNDGAAASVVMLKDNDDSESSSHDAWSVIM